MKTTFKGHFWSVAKVALRFGCAKQSKNLEWYLVFNISIASEVRLEKHVFCEGYKIKSVIISKGNFKLAFFSVTKKKSLLQKNDGTHSIWYHEKLRLYLWLRFNWLSLGSEVLCLLTKQDPGWKFEINWAIDVRWEGSNCQQAWITCLSFSVQGNLTRAFVIFPFWISFLISSEFKPEPSKGSFPLKISNIRVPKANTSSVLRGCSGSCN